jgi:hypothetical protein
MSSSTFSCVMVLVPQLHLNDSLRGVYVRLMMASPCSWPWSYQAVRARLTTPGAPALTAACTQLAHASWSSWDRQRARSAGAWRPWSSSRRSCRSPSCRTVCMMWVVDVQRAGSAAQRSSSSVKRGEGPSCGVCVDAYPCFFGGMAMGSARGVCVDVSFFFATRAVPPSPLLSRRAMHPKKRCTSSSGMWSALPKTSAAPPSACSSRHTSCPRTNERPSLSCTCSSCVDVHKVTHPSSPPSPACALATQAKVALSSGGEPELLILSHGFDVARKACCSSLLQRHLLTPNEGSSMPRSVGLLHCHSKSARETSRRFFAVAPALVLSTLPRRASSHESRATCFTRGRLALRTAGRDTRQAQAHGTLCPAQLSGGAFCPGQPRRLAAER